MKIKNIWLFIFTVFILSFFAFPVYADPLDYTLLHEFAGGVDDGKYPYGSLIESSGILYGMTQQGGDSGTGVIFSLNTDGTNYTHLHEFAGGGDDGKYASGGLIESSDTLYGMTIYGGDLDRGVIFSLNTADGTFTLLHEFAGGGDDGKYPTGGLIESGGTLYGMTQQGGDLDTGVIFSVDTDGSDYTLLHEFAGGADDGRLPYGSPTLSGDTLYGMTQTGGDPNYGVIFSLNTDGNNYTHLHEFAGGGDDGRYASGGLMESSGILYGMTQNGGDSNRGVIFSLNTNGSGYTLLHEFAGGGDDGRFPYGNLTPSGNTLYGMTKQGGDLDTGVIFLLNADGSNYTLIHEFAGGGDDGKNPLANGLIESSGTLYGMTFFGGDNNSGVIFSLDTGEGGVIPEPASFLLLGIGVLGIAGVSVRKKQ